MNDLGEQFLSTLGGCLVSLPYDLRVLFEAMSQEDLDRATREMVTGAAMYILSHNDAAPADQPHLAFADDVVLLRLALARIAARDDEASKAFTERFPEQFESLEEDLTVFRGYLGDVCRWLEAKVDVLPKTVYKGKRVQDYLDDEDAGAFLYDEGLSFNTDYEIDEEIVGRLKKPEPFRQYLERRMAEDSLRIS